MQMCVSVGEALNYVKVYHIYHFENINNFAERH